ncbi:hypothetical protein DFR86_11830 [Acidianus sulfidivorans JP7]|uniref:hypothetical protein n=1 Tax=Acidianus sulfidivorans TaxID=312539 RepID=UPI0013A5B1D9|nr:hypothetical protein [Acidianus sulfidivorans]QIJ32889.1 hypothetical protein DFR86_11830 [Acidianus sulfidivorans JP7]
MILTVILFIRIVLTMIGTITAVFGIGYILLAKFNPININKRDLIVLSASLLFVTVASFIISFIIL